MRSTLEKDNTVGTDEALLDIYRKACPGEISRPKSQRRCKLEKLASSMDRRHDLPRRFIR